VLGALNAMTLDVITVTNTTYVNANTVCEMLEKLVSSHATPVTVVLDNAKYQRCKLVRTCAETFGIELLFLPSYSPQLNLIERFWRLVKKECLYCRYYPDFDAFKAAIAQFIDNAHKHHHHQMKSLLTLKFQSFQNIAILPNIKTSNMGQIQPS